MRPVGPAESAPEPVSHGANPEVGVGAGVRRVHRAGQVEVVRNRDHSPVARANRLGVVTAVLAGRAPAHGPVRVPHHVLEDLEPAELFAIQRLVRDFGYLERHEAVPPRQDLQVLDEERVAAQRVAPFRVHVRDLDEPNPEAPFRHQVVEAVHQVLLQHVLLVVALAVGDELELVLAGEHRALRLLAREVEAERRKAAVLTLAPVVPARPHLDLEPHALARRVEVLQAGGVVGALAAALHEYGGLIELEGEPEDLVSLKQPICRRRAWNQLARSRAADQGEDHETCDEARPQLRPRERTCS